MQGYPAVAAVVSTSPYRGACRAGRGVCVSSFASSIYTLRHVCVRMVSPGAEVAATSVCGVAERPRENGECVARSTAEETKRAWRAETDGGAE